MLIAIPLFDGITALDAVGPYEVLSRLPKASVKFVATEPGPKRTDRGSLALTADYGLAEVTKCDVLLVPGGPGQAAASKDDRLLAWLVEMDQTTSFTTSVCTGSLILAASGLLRGRRATTHWLCVDKLADHGAVYEDSRVVTDGKYVTAAGVSAGIDMALVLAAQIAGDKAAQAIQLSVEYDPQPPFQAGSPASAPVDVVDLVRALARRQAKSDTAASE